MAEDSISEPSVHAAGRFQFRLRSIFILMAIVAFAFGGVPAWYRYVIVPRMLPDLEYHEFPDGPRDSWKEAVNRSFTLYANRYWPAFSLLAVAGCFGLWFAYVQPTKRISDIWLGLSFGVSLVIVVYPPLITSIYGLILIKVVVAYDMGGTAADRLLTPELLQSFRSTPIGR